MNLPATLNFDNSNPDAIFVFGGLIKLVEIYPNTGQIKGVPKNPRYILEKGVEDLQNSIKDDPGYLMAHPLVLFPYAGAYVAIEGNMRREACVANGMIEVPALVLNPKTPVEKLIAYIMKGNISYGKFDYDILANEYVIEDLNYWGMELPEIEVEPQAEPETDREPEVTITLKFRGHIDKFDLIKDRIETIIMDYPMIDLK